MNRVVLDENIINALMLLDRSIDKDGFIIIRVFDLRKIGLSYYQINKLINLLRNINVIKDAGKRKYELDITKYRYKLSLIYSLLI